MKITLLDFESGEVELDFAQPSRVKDEDIPQILKDFADNQPITQNRKYCQGERTLTVGDLLKEYDTIGAWGW